MTALPPHTVDPHIMAERLAAIVESSADAIVSQDMNDVVQSWNQSAVRIFGFTAMEMVGAPMARLIPPGRQDEEDFIQSQVRQGLRVEGFETWRLTKDGRSIEVAITASPICDRAGRIVGVATIARDITVAKLRERELTRMTRLYAALGQMNQAIGAATTREALFGKICQVLVAHGGFELAWIGEEDRAERRIVPVAIYGGEKSYAKDVAIYTDDRPEGRGPTGLAFRHGRPYICNDLQTDPAAQPWLSEIERYGFRASAAFPIRCEDRVCATLTVYAAEADFFRDKEIALLTEAADDISFALDGFVRQDERKRAEEQVRQERDFSAAMLNSMPGVIYLYDRNGRFLRWNENFTRVTGYTGAELEKMHPIDLIADADKAEVAARIRAVFESGESSVEAGFLTKSGKVIPYYFTGMVTQFEGQPCLVGVGIDLSVRKQAEEALQQSEAKLRALFEQAPLGIALIDSDTGRFLKINPQYCSIVGYSEAEMLAGDFQRITHPDDLAADLASMRRLREGAIKTFQIEKRYVRKDSSHVWVMLTCVPLWSGPLGEPQHIAMVEDITDRKQAEVWLAESERKYRELVELANSIILRWNAEGKITFVNDFGLRFFGYTAEEIIGREVVGTIVPRTDTAGRDLAALIAQIGSSPETFEKIVNENVRRSGERVWIAWTNRILREAPDGIVEILSVGADITKQRQAETALRELNETLEHKVATRTEELQSALVRAEAADQIKSAFLATMSHELRTPLNSIIGFTGIVLQGLAGPLNAEQSKQLGMVRSSARHLLELINDVLDISKIEAGQLEVRVEPFSLPAAIEHVTASVKVQAEKKGLALYTAVDPTLGEMASDRRRVEQILLNLLNNAIKFTERGSVTLVAEPVASYQRSPDDRAGPAVRLRVVDTGIGIKAEDLAKLFQPFRQIDSGLTRSHEGTGLGLAICRRLAVMLGGAISVASECGRGSVFTVTLPLQRTSGA